MDTTVPQEELTQESFTYSGKGSEFALLMYKNLLLTILTLGIYSAWGRTNTRRYMWGQTMFMGDRATYTGQGKELFIGWLLVGAIYFGAYFVITMCSSYISSWFGLLIIPLYAYVYALILYGGTRYRVAKTTWRGIRFGVDKNKKLTREFVILSLKYGLITVLTLGMAFPLYLFETKKFLTNKMRFGSSYFRFEGNRREFYFLCSRGVLFTFLTLGLYLPWLQCRIIRFKLENTKFQNASFKVGLTGKDLFIYSWGCFFGVLFTFGLAMPWLINWGNKMIINSLQLVGTIDWATIENMESAGEATADVAAVEYDVDLAF